MDFVFFSVGMEKKEKRDAEADDGEPILERITVDVGEAATADELRIFVGVASNTDDVCSFGGVSVVGWFRLIYHAPVLTCELLSAALFLLSPVNDILARCFLKASSEYFEAGLGKGSSSPSPTSDIVWCNRDGD
ncbi:MAG: hypothetical protein ACREQ3_25215 [Candidatus Binatia bacterium]